MPDGDLFIHFEIHALKKKTLFFAKKFLYSIDKTFSVKEDINPQYFRTN